MQKYRVDKLDIEVSRLGMGHMRLPTIDGAIDFEQGCAMTDALIAGGVTYFDTAYFYHGGQSEDYTRRALVERHTRDAYTVATKLPVGECKTLKDAEDIYETQRTRLGVDCIDFYLLHGISLDGWRFAQKLGIDAMLKSLKSEGKIRFAGFSFHGAADDLPTILDEFDWDFVQIQLNYYDWLNGDAKKLYDALTERNIMIVVMEPVRGGGLATLSDTVKAEFADLSTTPAALALRFVADLPHVAVVLSGMSSIDQVNQNIATFTPLVPLSPAETLATACITDAIKALGAINCTACDYCAKCPQNIKISRIFSAYNDYLRFHNPFFYRFVYKRDDFVKADACIECGACEKACPQKLNIIESLKLVDAVAKEY